jgi:hypothetical protein
MDRTDAMKINITSNLGRITGNLRAKLIELQQNPDPMLRTVALAVLPEMKRRVHVDGKDSSGQLIGTYSPGYMKVRTGDFKNSKRYTRGKNAGKLKDAGTYTDRTIRLDKQTGVFSREEKVGMARPKYNRTNDPKVILSLTRQMENDMSVVESGTGYGIGYTNPDNFKKAGYCETTYKKKILTQLTSEERELGRTVGEAYVSEFLNSQ